MKAPETLTVVDLATGEARELLWDALSVRLPHAYRVDAAYRVGRWHHVWCLGPDGVAEPWAAVLADDHPLAEHRGRVVLLPRVADTVPAPHGRMREAVLGGAPAWVGYVPTTVESPDLVRGWLAAASRHPAGRPPNVTDLLRARRRARPSRPNRGAAAPGD